MRLSLPRPPKLKDFDLEQHLLKVQHLIEQAIARVLSNDADIDIRHDVNIQGDLTMTGRVVTGTASASGRFGNQLDSDFTSDGSGATAGLLYVSGTITGADGDTSQQAVTWLGGRITTQDNSETISLATQLYVQTPTITEGTDTVTTECSVYIQGAPNGGTNNYALFVDAGAVRIDQGVALGGGSTPTLGTIGGSGPSSAGQAQWLEINIGGTAHWIPAWT